ESATAPTRALLPPADYDPSALSTHDDHAGRDHALGATTLEGTTGNLTGAGVPTIVGTHPSDGLVLDAPSASVAVPVVTAEVPPIASTTMVAPALARPARTGKLVTIVAVAAALGGAAAGVAVMVGREARQARSPSTEAPQDGRSE